MYDCCIAKKKLGFLKSIVFNLPSILQWWYFCWSAVIFCLNLFHGFQDHCCTCFFSGVLNWCLFFRDSLMWKKRRKSKLVLMSKNYEIFIKDISVLKQGIFFCTYTCIFVIKDCTVLNMCLNCREKVDKHKKWMEKLQQKTLIDSYAECYPGWETVHISQ